MYELLLEHESNAQSLLLLCLQTGLTRKKMKRMMVMQSPGPRPSLGLRRPRGVLMGQRKSPGHLPNRSGIESIMPVIFLQPSCTLPAWVLSSCGGSLGEGFGRHERHFVCTTKLFAVQKPRPQPFLSLLRDCHHIYRRFNANLLYEFIKMNSCLSASSTSPGWRT